jgi:hypothetical protein
MGIAIKRQCRIWIAIREIRLNCLAMPFMMPIKTWKQELKAQRRTSE